MAPKLVRQAVLAILAGLLSVGCIPLFYAYPTLAHVPAVAVDTAPDEIRAFRVDVADQEGCPEFPQEDRYLLTPVRLSRTGAVPGQTAVALDYGWVWNCIALVYDGHTRHSVMVRLYRPGWQTVEIKAGEKTGRVIWKEAADAAAREQAVDDLLSTWQTDGPGQLEARHQPSYLSEPGKAVPPRDTTVFRSLAPGSAGAGHRQALRFAATEYDRLAERLGVDHEARARLADKAKWLRELCEK